MALGNSYWLVSLTARSDAPIYIQGPVLMNLMHESAVSSMDYPAAKQSSVWICAAEHSLSKYV